MARDRPIEKRCSIDLDRRKRWRLRLRIGSTSCYEGSSRWAKLSVIR